MSHFTCAVFLPKEIGKPYHEWRNAVKTWGEKFLAKEPNGGQMALKALADNVYKCYEEVVKPYLNTVLSRYDETRQVEPYFRKDEYTEPDDEDYVEVNGEGGYMSRYNPDSRFDYWCVGERWTGTLTGNVATLVNVAEVERIKKAKIAENPDKYSPDTEFWMFGVPTPTFPNERYNPALGALGLINDFCAVAEIAESFRPFAFVDLEGNWNEKGKMGWWAAVSNEKDDGEWNAAWNKACVAYNDKWVILLDCHI